MRVYCCVISETVVCPDCEEEIYLAYVQENRRCPNCRVPLDQQGGLIEMISVPEMAKMMFGVRFPSPSKEIGELYQLWSLNMPSGIE